MNTCLQFFRTPASLLHRSLDCIKKTSKSHIIREAIATLFDCLAVCHNRQTWQAAYEAGRWSSGYPPSWDIPESSGESRGVCAPQPGTFGWPRFTLLRFVLSPNRPSVPGPACSGYTQQHVLIEDPSSYLTRNRGRGATLPLGSSYVEAAGINLLSSPPRLTPHIGTHWSQLR